MKFKLIGTGIAALSMLATSFAAQAADIPRPIYKGVRSVVAYYNWTGFYAGINGGYGWGRSEWTDGTATTGEFDIQGWLFGGTLGYNYQVGSIVFGIEGDYNWSNIKGSTSSGPCAGTTCETSNTWLATVRGRIGYAFDRFMPYITGGLAYGNIKANTPLGTDSSNEGGWTIGGGLEYAITGNWTAKAEYLYVKLNDGSCSAACGSPATPVAVTFDVNIVRLGLNYKFSGPIFSRF
jgi:outer membrane immunogenic protein